MEKLLGDKWDNMLLQEAFTQSLQYVREGEHPVAQLFRSGSVHLFDNYSMEKLDSPILVIESNDEVQLLLISKQDIVKSLEKSTITNCNVIIDCISAKLIHMGEEVLNDKTQFKLTPKEFGGWLQRNNLEDIAKELSIHVNNSFGII